MNGNTTNVALPSAFSVKGINRKRIFSPRVVDPRLAGFRADIKDVGLLLPRGEKTNKHRFHEHF